MKLYVPAAFLVFNAKVDHSERECVGTLEKIIF
jgi:hypothetical protein